MAFEWVEDQLLGLISSGLPQYANQIAWKNLKFDPASRILWLKVINTPITEDSATLGLHGENENVGFVQIGVYQKAGTGTAKAKEAIDALNTLLAIPRRLNAPPGCLLRLTNKTSGQGGQTSLADSTTGGAEGLWDAHYLTVYWLAREPR